MKRFFGIRTALFLLALVVIAALAATDFAQAEKSLTGSLVRVRGDVSWLAAGSATWKTATERQRVSEGDKLRTGAKSSAVVRLSKGNFISLGEKAEITLSKASARAAKDPDGLFGGRISEYDIKVDLGKGQAVNVLKNLKGKSDYKLATPIATAGVRGTVFLARVSWPEPRKTGMNLDGEYPQTLGQAPSGGQPEVLFGVKEGRVDITNNVGNLIGSLTDGQQMTIIPTGPDISAPAGLGPGPQVLEPNTVNEIQQFTSTVQQLDESSPENERSIQQNLIQPQESQHYY